MFSVYTGTYTLFLLHTEAQKLGKVTNRLNVYNHAWFGSPVSIFVLVAALTAVLRTYNILPSSASFYKISHTLAIPLYLLTTDDFHTLERTHMHFFEPLINAMCEDVRLISGRVIFHYYAFLLIIRYLIVVRLYHLFPHRNNFRRATQSPLKQSAMIDSHAVVLATHT
jgi:hypothetical protein